MSIESVMSSNHLILCRPLLLLPSVFPSIRVFSSESVLRIRCWRIPLGGKSEDRITESGSAPVGAELGLCGARSGALWPSLSTSISLGPAPLTPADSTSLLVALFSPSGGGWCTQGTAHRAGICSAPGSGCPSTVLPQCSASLPGPQSRRKSPSLTS